MKYTFTGTLLTFKISFSVYWSVNSSIFLNYEQPDSSSLGHYIGEDKGKQTGVQQTIATSQINCSVKMWALQRALKILNLPFHIPAFRDFRPFMCQWLGLLACSTFALNRGIYCEGLAILLSRFSFLIKFTFVNFSLLNYLPSFLQGFGWEDMSTFTILHHGFLFILLSQESYVCMIALDL